MVNIGEFLRPKTINRIYEGIPYANERNYTDLSLAGGETNPESVEKILKYFTPRRHNFYDLGSGRGKVVIQAAFSNRIKKVVGIEIIKERNELALKALDRAKSNEIDIPKIDLQFINDSFFNIDFSDADIIYTVATAFDDQMMKELELRFAKLKESSVIIVVDKELDIKRFKLIATDKYKMDYGNGDVFVYEKRKEMDEPLINR